VEIFEHWRKFEKESQSGFPMFVVDWMEQYARDATRKLRREDRNLVVRLATGIGEGEFGSEDLAADLVMKQLKCDPQDPHLLCLAWTYGERPSPSPAQLKAVKDEAIARRDRAALDAIAEYEREEARSAAHFGGGPFGGGFFDDDDEDEDEEDDDFEFTSSLSDGEANAIADKLMEELINLPRSQRVAHLVREGLDRDRAEMMADVVEYLAELRRSTQLGPSPQPRKGTSSGPPPRPRKGDSFTNTPRRQPSQLDFPF
jgi:hypothetical protein